MSTLGYNWKLWKIMANVATYNPILGRFPQDYCPLDYSFLCESLLDNCLLNNFYLGLHPLDDSVPDNPPHPPLIPTEYCLLFLWVKGNTLRIHVLKKIKENENFERKSVPSFQFFLLHFSFSFGGENIFLRSLSSAKCSKLAYQQKFSFLLRWNCPKWKLSRLNYY